MSKRSGCKQILALAAVTGLGVLSATQAQASFTTIGAPNYGRGGELSPTEILSAVYGSGVSYTRIDDSEDGSAPTTLDVTSAKAIGTYAKYYQNFGYADANGNGVVTLFTATGHNTTSPGGSTGAFTLAKGDTLVRYGSGTIDYSKASLNSDGKDHMVTYLIDSKSSKTSQTFVVFFEDLPKGKGDFDFNDLAVEIKTSTPVVPLPAAAWSGLATMAGSAGVAGFRKMRRQMA